MSPTNTVTAYLSDGRHVDVPASNARDWAESAAELDTTIGLADWYTEQGDENQDQIQGVAHDDPRCEHVYLGADVVRIRVSNASQGAQLDAKAPLVSTIVCGKRACILDAMAYVERAIPTEPAVWVDPANVVHTLPPRGDVTTPPLSAPLDIEAAKKLVRENGFVTLTKVTDLGEYLGTLARTDDDDPENIEDYIHDLVLDFGSPYESSVVPVAIDGDRVTIEYTVNLTEMLNYLGEGV